MQLTDYQIHLQISRGFLSYYLVKARRSQSRNMQINTYLFCMTDLPYNWFTAAGTHTLTRTHTYARTHSHTLTHTHTHMLYLNCLFGSFVAMKWDQ